VTIDGRSERVLRFSNTAWNAGPGPLHLCGQTLPGATTTRVYQRIYDEPSPPPNCAAGGTYVEHLAGEFVFHPAHNHWHFEDFADYELWTRAD
jgi:hypothetical protein